MYHILGLFLVIFVTVACSSTDLLTGLENGMEEIVLDLPEQMPLGGLGPATPAPLCKRFRKDMRNLDQNGLSVRIYTDNQKSNMKVSNKRLSFIFHLFNSSSPYCHHSVE